MPRKDIPQNIPQDKLDDGNVADSSCEKLIPDYAESVNQFQYFYR